MATSTSSDKPKLNKQQKDRRDIFVKLNKVCSSCYITNTGYVLRDELNITSGTFICKLEPYYMDIITETFFKNNGVKIIYIPAVNIIKDDITEYKKIDDLNIINKINTIIDNFLYKIIPNVNEWKDFILSEDGTDEIDMFKNNKYVELYADDGSSVIIGKELTPLVTEKNYKNNLKYGIYNINSEINALLFDFTFTHFRMHNIFYYVIM